MKKLILLFCISIPFLCGNVKAQTNSAASLVSIICDTEAGDLANPKNEIGKSLLGDGFSLIGESREPGLLGYEKMVLVKKVYKKGDYTIESQHYINGEEKEIGPIYLKIDFPSSDLCNQFFQDIVKRVKEDEEYWNEVPGGDLIEALIPIRKTKFHI